MTDRVLHDWLVDRHSGYLRRLLGYYRTSRIKQSQVPYIFPSRNTMRLGFPETPISIVNPFCFSILWRYFDDNFWKLLCKRKSWDQPSLLILRPADQHWQASCFKASICLARHFSSRIRLFGRNLEQLWGSYHHILTILFIWISGLI